MNGFSLVIKDRSLLMRNAIQQAIESKWVATCRSLLCALAILLASSGPAMAQAGKLDHTFGNGGISFLNFSSCCSSPLANVVALQSDGKIVVGGQVGSTSGPRGTLARLTSSGKLDDTFGSGGFVTADFENFRADIVVGLAIQSDGKILASATGTFIGGFRVARFNPNGSLDTAFGTNGFATAAGLTTAGPLLLQSDGKILVLGSEFNAFSGTGVLVRFDSNGQLDPTFGHEGVAVLLAVGSAIALQSDGKILVGSGASGPPGVIGDELGPVGAGAGSLARYNPDGSVDKSFGVSGQTASVLAPFAIAVQVDGRIVAAGSIVSALVLGGNSSGFGVVRFNANGSVDTTFGTGGGTASGFPQTVLDGALGMALQLNGDIVLVGEAGNFNPSFAMNFALARYTGAGHLDPLFGTGGLVTTSFLDSTVNWISAVVIQIDGKIVVAGNAAGQIAVARYLAQ